MTPDRLTPRERKWLLRIVVALAIPFALIALTPAVVMIVILDNETDARLDDQRRTAQTLALQTNRIGALARRNNELAVRLKMSVCSFRAQQQESIDFTVVYLAKHPGDRPFPGIDISRDEILSRLERQRDVLRSLTDPGCKKGGTR